tara:strand:+ start:436 stop:726 length:291 start_codon:yes stop_codon:yes gene_type:complete
MKHYLATTSEFRIIHNNSSNTGEVTIQLGLSEPTVTVSNSSYISGVYDSSSGKKNPGMPYCEVDEQKPTITDEWRTISSGTKHQMTLNLKTKLKQL